MKDIRQKCTWSHLLSSKRREGRNGGGGGGRGGGGGGERKICMCVDSFSWMQFYLLLIFSGPHKVKPYIWNQTNAHSRRKVRFMLRSMCVVLWSVHMVSGWARAGCINPTLRWSQLPFTLVLLQIFAHLLWVQTVTSEQPGTSGDTWKQRGLTGLIQGRRQATSWSQEEWLYTKVRGVYQLTWVHPDRLRWRRLRQPFPVVRYINPSSVNL